MAELKEEEKNNFPEVKSTQNKIKLMITSTQHHHPYDEKICNGYTLSLTQLFGLIHFATRAVLVVLPLQQWLLNIFLFHVCERTPPLVSLRSLFFYKYHSNPENGEKTKRPHNQRRRSSRTFPWFESAINTPEQHKPKS